MAWASVLPPALLAKDLEDVSSLISTFRYISPGGRPGAVRPLRRNRSRAPGRRPGGMVDEHLVSRALLVERQLGDFLFRRSPDFYHRR